MPLFIFGRELLHYLQDEFFSFLIAVVFFKGYADAFFVGFYQKIFGNAISCCCRIDFSCN